MPKRIRVKSQEQLRKQASNIMTRLSGNWQPINYLGNGHIGADTNGVGTKTARRMERVAAIYNRYADNLRPYNQGENNKTFSSDVYMRGNAPDTREVKYTPRDGKARMAELRAKYANRNANAAKASGGQG